MNRLATLLIGLGIFATTMVIRIRLAEITADVENEVGPFLTILGPVLMAVGGSVIVWRPAVTRHSVAGALFLTVAILSLSAAFIGMLWREANQCLTIIPEITGVCATVLLVIVYREQSTANTASHGTLASSRP
jgi:hypothetical protein